MSPRALLAHSSLTAIFILLSIFLTILGEHQQYVRDEQAAVKAAGTGTPEYGVFSYLYTAVQSEAQYCLDLVKAKVRPGKPGQNDPADARGRPTSEESFKRRPTSKESLKNLSRVLSGPSGGKATPSGRRPSQRELSKMPPSTSPEQARLPLPEIGNAGLSVLLANQQVLLKQMLSEQKDIKAEQREIKAELSTAQSTWLRATQTTSAPHASSADVEITDRAAVIDATIVELLLEQKRIAETVAKKFEVAPARSAIKEEPGSARTTSKVGVERKHGHGERRKKEAHRSPHRGASTDVALLSSLEVNDSLEFRRAGNRHSKAGSDPGSPTKYTDWMDGSEHGSESPSPPASVCNFPGRKRRHRKRKGTDAAARTEAAAAAEAAAATVASATGSSASKANSSLLII